MPDHPFNYLQESLATPLGDLIASIGEGVAEAQAALDAGSLAQTLAIYDGENSEEVYKQLRAIGYQPTFYVLPDTKVKAKVALTITQSSESSPAAAPQNALSKTASSYTSINRRIDPSALAATPRLSRTKMYATPLNASTTNRFNMQYQASVELEFTIKAVPPPPGAEIRVVPNLVDQPFNDDLIELLNQVNLTYSLGDDAIENYTNPRVDSQTPSAGSILRADEVVELVLKEAP